MCEYIRVHLRSAYWKGFGGFMSDVLWGHGKNERLWIIESPSISQVDHVLSFHHSQERSDSPSAQYFTRFDSDGSVLGRDDRGFVGDLRCTDPNCSDFIRDLARNVDEDCIDFGRLAH